MIGSLNIPAKNGNGIKVLDFCTKKNLCCILSAQGHMSCQRRESECKNIIDLIMVRKFMLKGVYDIKIVSLS